jgi:hypothetical protein
VQPLEPTRRIRETIVAVYFGGDLLGETTVTIKNKPSELGDKTWRDIPSCPLTIRECDDHSRGLAEASGIVELVRHFVQTRHWIDCTSTVPGLEDTVSRMQLEVGDVDTRSVSAALYGIWERLHAAKEALDEAGVRQASGEYTIPRTTMEAVE